MKTGSSEKAWTWTLLRQHDEVWWGFRSVPLHPITTQQASHFFDRGQHLRSFRMPYGANLIFQFSHVAHTKTHIQHAPFLDRLHNNNATNHWRRLTTKEFGTGKVSVKRMDGQIATRTTKHLLAEGSGRQTQFG
jgi:hypothetical protein